MEVSQEGSRQVFLRLFNRYGRHTKCQLIFDTSFLSQGNNLFFINEKAHPMWR